jgi:hypothetical protein
MAIQAGITAQGGAPALLQKVQVMQRKINFADQTALATGAHFELLDLEAGDVVIGGSLTVLTAGTATAKIAIGTAGGTNLLTATLVDTTAGTVTAFTATTGIVVGNDTVDIAASVAAAAAGEIMVTAVVLKGADFTG